MYWQHSIQWSNGKVLRWKLESSLQQIWNFEFSHWTKERKLIFDSIIWLFVLLSNIWISFSKYLQPSRILQESYHCNGPKTHYRLLPLCRTIITISSLLIIFHDNNNSNNDYNSNDEDQADDEEIGVQCNQSSIPGGAAGPRTGATCRSVNALCCRSIGCDDDDEDYDYDDDDDDFTVTKL